MFIYIFKRLRIYDPVTLKDSEKLAQLHSKKKDIPTMAGIIFVIPLLVFMKAKLYAEVFLIIACFVIGLVDDILKISKRNFSIRFRLWFEFFPVFLYLLYKIKTGELSAILRVTPSMVIQLPYYTYVMLTSFIFVGIVNSFNITDGVDGLLGLLTTQIVVVSLLLLPRFNVEYSVIYNCLYVLVGSLIAYLIFNFPPAKIFMGNVGSVTLGAVVATIYLLYNLHLFLLVVCSTLIMNTISVMIQSFSYRIFGKRIFSIAPLHHALEFKGFGSIQIDLIYFFTNLIINGLLLFFF